jgi:hypothetical protein
MKNYLGFFKTNRTLLGSVLVVSVGFLSVQVVNAGSPVIKGCVSKVSGLVRIASKCAKNENLISWNQLGVQGLPGIQGLQGDTGKQGDQGLAGPKGDTGLQGPQGLAGLNGANGYSGSAGPQGPAGKHLVVLDANGNLVGYPIDLGGGGDTSTVIGTQNPFTSLQIYLDKEKIVASVSLSGIPTFFPFLWTNLNCTGSATEIMALGDYGYPYSKLATKISPTAPIVWYQADAAALASPATGTVTFLSSGGEGQCINKTTTLTASGGDGFISFHTIPAPFAPFVGPLSLAVANS